jgi:hypothetical protein
MLFSCVANAKLLHKIHYFCRRSGELADYPAKEHTMSALLQFKGKTSREKGVGLMFYLVDEVTPYEGATWKKKVTREEVDCTICNKQHPQLYRAWRKPAGRFGCWIVFRYLGDEHVPDLSVPICVQKVPYGGKALSQEENSEYWHA